MANKAIFKAYPGKLLPGADTKNRRGTPAYSLDACEALAQLAVTGTFNETFYAGASEQLADVVRHAELVEPEFLAKTAIYAAEKGHMKDVPVMLLAILSKLEGDAFSRAFPRVVRNGKMLRGFVQVMRSGAAGRKSLGTRPKRAVRSWLDSAGSNQILKAMVGNDPSLADVIRMVHPKPASEERRALYAWAVRKPYEYAALPEAIKALEAFRRDQSLPLPDVPFQMLTSLTLTAENWVVIARRSGWQMLRQNLNTFARKSVFEVEGFTQELSARLRDPDAIRKSRVFPYQVLVSWAKVDAGVPEEVREALQEALEIALANVPATRGRVVLCPDVSGSMGSPVTGYRRGAASAVRCIDVAGLMAAALLKHNPKACVLPFEHEVVDVSLNRRDSVMTNAEKLASVGGGGTNCSAPLARLADERSTVDLVVLISDNQSWVDASRSGQATGMLKQWARIKRRNPAAKLVCVDIQPYATTQARTADDILNIGGFSDAVFETIRRFASGEHGADSWVSEIESVRL